MSTLTVSDPVLLEFASEIGPSGPVAIEGGRTRWDIGGDLADGTRILRAPSGIVEYKPEEMVVTVRAGTPVAELHAELAERGQRTALPERGGTVGGAVAVGENDHRSLGRGTIRESLLQIRYVGSDGRLVTGGGPTVKNVTGFDLPHLMTGSLGTLGCFAECMLRTNPVPDVSGWYEADDADPFMAYRTLLSPSAVMWNGHSTLIQIEGHEVDVESQAARLAELGSFIEVDAPPAPAGHRWSLKPSDLRRMDEWETGSFMALVGVGTVWADHPQPPRSLPRAVAEINRRVKANFDPDGRLNPGRSPL